MSERKSRSGVQVYIVKNISQVLFANNMNYLTETKISTWDFAHNQIKYI